MARVRPAQFTDELSDIWRLVVGYTKQETAAPLRGLWKFMGWGFAALTCTALGTVFAALAILRAFETESGRFNAYLSFVPYLTAFIVCAIVLGLAVRSATKQPWKKGETQK